MSDNKELDTIILVGGKGTRLRSVVGDRPKPMAEVRGRPFLEWLIVGLRKQGVRRIILATGYRANQFEAYFRDGSDWGVELVYSQETMPLGTGGAIRNAISYVDSGQTLILNGDSYCPFQVNTLVSMHEKKSAAATLWLVQMDDCSRYGVVEVGRDNEIICFNEKSNQSTNGLINAGVYLFETEVVQSISPGQYVSLEKEVLPSFAGKNIQGIIGQGPFIDIGTPESFSQADRFFADIEF